MSRHTTTESSGLRSLFPEFSSGKSIWVCNEKGSIIDSANDEKWAIPADYFLQLLKSRSESQSSDEAGFELNAVLPNGQKQVFSCLGLNFQNHNLLVFRMKEEQNESSWKTGFMAEEFGIYPWRYETRNSVLTFGQGLGDMLGFFGNRMELDDFLSKMSPESLTRFTEALENALNFGKSFKTEILIEGDHFFRWLSISGRTETNDSSPVIAGFVRDISAEKAEKERLIQLENWVRAGMNRLLVTDGEGNLLADLGNEAAGQILEEEPGRRKVKMVDFRNQVKFIIEAQTGSRSASILPKEITEEKAVSEIEENGPLSREEKFTAITRSLGIKTESQVSAFGIFDGSRFEWKAWWKSPSGYALPSKKYAGEWLPDLTWLLEMESENGKYQDRLWWPQDMLPFPIADVFGQGWMLLTDQLSSGETGLVALRSKHPETLMGRKEEVLGLLQILKEKGEKQKPSSGEIELLKEELSKKDVLLKELNHRAKNNLALAASLVKMQAGYAEDKKTSQFLRQTQKRLETLASLHQLMYMGAARDGKIEIQTYLNELLQGLHAGFGNPEISLEMHFDEAEIQARFAVTIGLLVNEICSNAYKHAFPEGRSGVLRIDFLIRGEFFKLRVSDNGPGFDAGDAGGNSLGNLLIDEFVKQLGAEMEISRNPGTTYLISIKKSNIGL